MRKMHITKLLVTHLAEVTITEEEVERGVEEEVEPAAAMGAN